MCALRVAAAFAVLATSALGESSAPAALSQAQSSRNIRGRRASTMSKVNGHDGSQVAGSDAKRGIVSAGASSAGEGEGAAGQPQVAVHVVVNLHVQGSEAGADAKPSPPQAAAEAPPLTVATLAYFRAHSDALFVKYDIDTNGVIAGAEKARLASDLSRRLSIEHHSVDHMMMLCEVNRHGNDGLDKLEFAVLMNQVARVKRVNFDFNVDGKRFECSGVLSMYRSNLVGIKRGDAMKMVSDMHVHAASAFQCFDSDGSGALEPKEMALLVDFTQALEKALVLGGPAMVEILLKTADLTGKGRVDVGVLDILMLLFKSLSERRWGSRQAPGYRGAPAGRND